MSRDEEKLQKYSGVSKSTKMPVSEELSLIGEKTLHQAVDPRLLAYCPSMELLALGSKDQQILIYRLNGQRVYGATQKGTALTVDRISWKPNGQLLGIGWSDGVVRLVGAESNKTVHQISTGPESSGISWLGWASNLTSKNAVQSLEAGTSWAGIVEMLPSEKLEDRSPLDLPRDIALIDIETSMPKLSVLPTGATAEDIFSTRASVDGLFRAFDPKDNDAVDVMVVGTNDGRVHLNIYDSFVIGSFPTPLSTPQVRGNSYQLVGHTSSKFYSTHALLFGPSRPNDESALYFIPMDLRFVSASSGYLPLLASKCTALQNLLRYIDQVQILMNVEWEATQDLPRKFLRNINETLLEKNSCDIVQALYHSVATGHTFPAVKDWLVDELAERGHKRWDKAVVTGLENLRKLVHEDMLPALERCSVILSRLTGIAKYQSLKDAMGFSSHQIDFVIETIACLNLICGKILIYVLEEIDHFTAFSSWLRYEIDRLASDASSAPNDDLMEKESTIDHSKVLLYIQTAMMNSRLSAFFKDPKSEDQKDDWEAARKGLPLFEIVDKALQRNETSLLYTTLTRVDVLCKYLNGQATAVFHQIAEAEKRNVLFGKPVDLGSDSINSRKVMRVCSDNSTSCKIFIGLAFGDRICMFLIQLKIENGISSQTSVSKGILDFESRRKVLDIAFLDEHNLMVLCQSDGKPPQLLKILYQSRFRYRPYKVAAEGCDAPEFTRTDIIGDDVRSEDIYNFPGNVAYIPACITISQLSGKRGEKPGPRICVLDKSRMQYRVLTLVKKENVSINDDDEDDDDIQMTQ